MFSEHFGKTPTASQASVDLSENEASDKEVADEEDEDTCRNDIDDRVQSMTTAAVVVGKIQTSIPTFKDLNK